MRTHHVPRPTLAFVAALAAIAVACAGQAGGSDVETDLENLDGDWLLFEGAGPGGEVELFEGYEVTLTIDGDDWGGVAACNNYGATVAVDGGDVRITELYQTEMACLDDGAMASEAAYLDAFGRVTTIALDGDVLQLTDNSGETSLRFEPAPEGEAAPVVGTAWRIDSLLEGDGPDGSATQAQDGASLVLHEGGRIVVDTACTTRSGSYELADDRLIIHELLGQSLGCPDAIAAQQDHILRVLSSDVHIQHDGNALTLTSDEGGLDLRAEG